MKRRWVLGSLAGLSTAGIGGCARYPRTRVSHTTLWFTNETDRSETVSCTIRRRDALPFVQSETAHAERLSVEPHRSAQIRDVVRPSREYALELEFESRPGVSHDFEGHHGVLYVVIEPNRVDFVAAPAEG